MVITIIIYKNRKHNTLESSSATNAANYEARKQTSLNKNSYSKIEDSFEHQGIITLTVD